MEEVRATIAACYGHEAKLWINSGVNALGAFCRCLDQRQLATISALRNANPLPTIAKFPSQVWILANWQARKKECKSPPAVDSPLALVLARLAQ